MWIVQYERELTRLRKSADKADGAALAQVHPLHGHNQYITT